MERSEYGPTIIFASGKNTLSHSSWTQNICNTLGKQCRVIKFDFKEPFEDEYLLDQFRSKVNSITPNKKQLILGGKSQGGRIAALLADEYQVAGCFCIGYPFYTPTITDNRRILPLQSIQTPTLIIQGEHDQYGEKKVVEQYILSKQVQIDWLPNAGHQLVSCEKIIAEKISNYLKSLELI